MKVGFVASPLSGGHSVRGIGFYTKNLLEHLVPQAKSAGMEVAVLKSPQDIHGQFDLIHYPFFDLFYPTLHLIPGTKTVVTVHDVIPLEFPRAYPPGLQGTLNLRRQIRTLNRADMVITDSYSSVNAIRKYLKVPDRKIQLIYLAAANNYQPVTSKTVLSQTKKQFHLPDKFVLYVGDVNWNKNIPSLVKACRLASLPLVLVGKQAAQLGNQPLEADRGLRDRIRAVTRTPHPQLAHMSGLVQEFASPGIIRPGFVSDQDLSALFTLASVYCQPSYAEGFGLPVLEAMSCGTPVACSRTHSLPEIAGDAAVYFDPGSVAEMAEVLGQVCSDKSLSARLSKAGTAQARRFSWEKTARDTLQVYRLTMGTQ